MLPLYANLVGMMPSFANSTPLIPLKHIEARILLRQT